MTLQQLKYVVTVARTGSMSEASKELFISQPGLTTSIRELETEMGIKIFTRTNKGVVTSNEGERFLGYAPVRPPSSWAPAAALPAAC